MDGYNMLKVLGEGSFGRALLVHHRISDQKYVMKEIRLPMVSVTQTSLHPPLKTNKQTKNPNSGRIFEMLNTSSESFVY